MTTVLAAMHKKFYMCKKGELGKAEFPPKRNCSFNVREEKYIHLFSCMLTYFRHFSSP